MTTEIEKQFFEAFRIEPKEITDRILLVLICILSQHYSWEEENWFLSCDSIDYLKQFILSHLIELQKHIWFCSKQQVQALFEENNNDR